MERNSIEKAKSLNEIVSVQSGELQVAKSHRLLLFPGLIGIFSSFLILGPVFSCLQIRPFSNWPEFIFTCVLFSLVSIVGNLTALVTNKNLEVLSPAKES